MALAQQGNETCEPPCDLIKPEEHKLSCHVAPTPADVAKKQVVTLRCVLSFAVLVALLAGGMYLAFSSVSAAAFLPAISRLIFPPLLAYTWPARLRFALLLLCSSPPALLLLTSRSPAPRSFGLSR